MHPSRRPSGRQALALLALLLGLGACAPARSPLARPAPATLPSESPLLSASLADADAWLRHHLGMGEHDAALALLQQRETRPRDPLQRALQRALVLHHAGRWERSNERFEWAERELDRRFTRSVSRGAAALLASDRALAWMPSPAEQAMIPYYRMLNYLALGERGAALVEARKANALGAGLGADRVDACLGGGAVQYLAGLVHRAGGERNDALVSLRHAEQGLESCTAAGAPLREMLARDLYRAARDLGVNELADSVRVRHDLEVRAAGGEPDTGELVLLLERGFVAHPAEHALHVPIFADEVAGLDGDAQGAAVADAAARIVARLEGGAAGLHGTPGAWDDHPAVHLAYAADGAYVLRVAWPRMEREPNRPAALRVWVDSALVGTTPLVSVSSRVERDLAARRPAMLTRLVARGLLRYLATRRLEEQAEEEGGELLGFLTGRIANLAGNALERADTRSWSLLPDDIHLVRTPLAPGEHQVRVEVLGADDRVLAVHALGSVRIEAGRPSILSRRVLDFGGAAPDPAGPRPARVTAEPSRGAPQATAR